MGLKGLFCKLQFSKRHNCLTLISKCIEYQLSCVRLLFLHIDIGKIIHRDIVAKRLDNNPFIAQQVPTLALFL